MFNLRVRAYEAEYEATIAWLARRGIEFRPDRTLSGDKCVDATLTAEELRNLRECLGLEKPYMVSLP